MKLEKKMKISFIIPCYNCEKTLSDTVESILSLKLNDFEICMVDDGSKDNTFKILKKPSTFQSVLNNSSLIFPLNDSI